MRIIKLIISLTIFVIPSLFALDLDVNHWSDYSGNLEGKPIRMSLYRFSNNQVRGHYYFAGTDEKIYLTGSIKNPEIKLYVIRNKQVEAVFKGKFFTNDKDRLEGSFTFKDKTTKELKLILVSTIASNYSKRYFLSDATTNEVETFAKQVKKAILEKNRNWLSENTYYPIKVSINGKTTKTIKSKKEFLKNFDLIFHSTFIEKAKEFEYFDMFCNYQGVMMGAGDIWMDCISVDVTEKCKMTITAINN